MLMPINYWPLLRSIPYVRLCMCMCALPHMIYITTRRCLLTELLNLLVTHTRRHGSISRKHFTMYIGTMHSKFSIATGLYTILYYIYLYMDDV